MKRRHPVLAALLLVACGGGASAPPASPGKGVDQHPESSEEPGAPREEGDELQFQQQPGYGQQPAPGGGATPAGPFAEEPPLTLEEATSALNAAATELSNAGSDCERACKALGSMQRSSGRICELNGPSDPGSRCQKARDRLEAARETLRKRCGSCEP